MSVGNGRSARAGRVGVAVLGLFLLSGTAGAVDTPSSGATRSDGRAFVDGTIPLIAGRLAEVEALRDRAAAEGVALRLSCVEQKLRRVRDAASAAEVVRAGYETATGDADYARRSVDRMRLLRLIARANADAARRCVGPAEVERALAPVKPSSAAPPPAPSPPDTAPAPFEIERPPLASNY